MAVTLGKLQKAWAIGIILSFFFELPLMQFGVDRLSPRLYDVLFILGFFLFRGQYMTSVHNSVYKSWKYIVFWFTFCAILWSFFFPFSYAAYSLFAAFRYIQGLIILKFILLSNLRLRDAGRVSLFGLLLVGIYCIYEYYFPLDGLYELTPGNFITVPAGALFGPLSPTYFHIGQLVPLASVLAFGYYTGVQYKKRMFYSLVILGASWPIFFSGTRMGLAIYALTFMVFLLTHIKKSVYMVIPLMAVIVYIVASGATSKLMENSLTFSRFEGIQAQYADKNDATDENSLKGRFSIGRRFQPEKYDNADWMPLIGAGFNIAPVEGTPRIGYGIHSMYIYPYEQGGVIACVLFLVFLLRAFRYLYRGRSNVMVAAVFSYFIAMLLVGGGAHNFWREFGSGNVNTFILIGLCLACKSVDEHEKGIVN